MRFKDYLRFKDSVCQVVGSFEVVFDPMIENSHLYEKRRIYANPKGYFFKISKRISQDSLDKPTREKYHKITQFHQPYFNEEIDKAVKSISDKNIIITDMTHRLKVDIVKKGTFTKIFEYVIEIDVKFDDLSYVALKTLMK